MRKFTSLIKDRGTPYCSVKDVVLQGLFFKKRMGLWATSLKHCFSRERQLNLLKIFFNYFGLVEHGRTFLLGPV